MTAGGQVRGPEVRPEIASRVAILIRFGLGAFETRSGVRPVIPGLGDLLDELDVAAASASGRPRRTLALPARTGGHYLTCNEAAEVMGLSARRVRHLAAAGVLIARKVGRDWQVDADSAAGWSERRQAWRAA